MAKYVLVALNRPVPGSDPAELERWYNEVHMPDLKSVKGIKSARRYKTVRGHFYSQELWPSLAIYEIETDDLAEVSKAIQKQCRPFHPSFDRSKSAHVFAIQISGDE